MLESMPTSPWIRYSRAPPCMVVMMADPAAMASYSGMSHPSPWVAVT